MLAIGRALMSRPKLILFDEPSLGLAPQLVERTFDIVKGICASGTTVLMVEQNAYAALDMCDHAYLHGVRRIGARRQRAGADRQPARPRRVSGGAGVREGHSPSRRAARRLLRGLALAEAPLVLGGRDADRAHEGAAGGGRNEGGLSFRGAPCCR